MWREFFKFDLALQLRQPLLWVCALLMALMAFGATSSDAVQVGGAIGNVHRNAPLVVAKLLATFSVLSMLVIAMFVAAPVLRDHEVGISDMLFATPMRKHDYLLGRFGAGMVACLVIFGVIAAGMMLGSLMPWLDASQLGAFPGPAYLWSLGFMVLPNLLFIGALLMLLAATTRSMLMVYVGMLGFFVLWIVGGVLARDIGNAWIPVLLDPFGITALGRMTRYYTTADANNALPAIGGYLLANRALWGAVTLVLLAATVLLFKPQRAGTGRRLFGKAKPMPAHAPIPAPAALPRIAPRFGSATGVTQFLHIFTFDTAAVLRSVPFLVMLLFAVLNLVAATFTMEQAYGTAVYPVTYLMQQAIAGSFNFMLVIILTFYAGELVFKERQVRIADVGDALPVPDWAQMLAKVANLVAVTFCFLAIGTVSAMLIQLVKGGVALEPLLHLKGMLLAAPEFLMLAMIALALQVLTNNKFIGYLLVVVLMVASTVQNLMHFEHKLYSIGSLPATPYSDMNGYGHFVAAWGWNALYWGLFTVALLIVAKAFWVRGLALAWRARAKLARQRLAGSSGMALAACLLGFAASGAWIFHNTVTLGRYEASDIGMDRQARYEKLYRQYLNAPRPKLTAVSANVDIYPERRRAAVNARYVVQNKTAAPITDLHLQVNPDVAVAWSGLPKHTVVLDDREAGFSILRLATPLASGASLELAFKIDIGSPGFANNGEPGKVHLNGTFFNNLEMFPRLGYQDAVELRDRNERRKRGLGEPQRMAKLEDQGARANHGLGGDGDWISFETTVSTSADQTAIAPGTLQKSWEKDGRRYYRYKMNQKMLPFFAYLSARWEVKKDDWKGVPIEVYYDKKHGYNVERMIDSTKKSLDYFSTEFTPYQHEQVRILEFPIYERFAQSFAGTIPYSEGIGFIADLRDNDAIDYVFFVTAHEVAHQWWGHQVVGANVQGSSMLVESLAEYSALMVMEKEYGRHKLRRFLSYELDRYLSGRGGELLEEQPLVRVENQQYIHYRKGSMVFYRLRDEIGEAALNRALKRFLQDKGYQNAPFTTSAELVEYIRAEAPADKQGLITDLFEKIVVYDNRVTDAKAVKRADGKWDVTMTLHLAKKEVDGKGVETDRAYDEAVEIAVFARASGAKEKDEQVLLAEKRLLTGSTPTITLTVADKPYEVGIDPYNKMIDRVSRDNRKEVSF